MKSIFECTINADGSLKQGEYQIINGSIKQINIKNSLLNQEEKDSLVNINFNYNGQVIYQTYNINKQILPLSDDSITNYTNMTENLITTIKANSRFDQQFIQVKLTEDNIDICRNNIGVVNLIDVNSILETIQQDNTAKSVLLIGSKKKNNFIITNYVEHQNISFECINKPEFN